MHTASTLRNFQRRVGTRSTPGDRKPHTPRRSSGCRDRTRSFHTRGTFFVDHDSISGTVRTRTRRTRRNRARRTRIQRTRDKTTPYTRHRPPWARRCHNRYKTCFHNCNRSHTRAQARHRSSSARRRFCRDRIGYRARASRIHKSSHRRCIRPTATDTFHTSVREKLSPHSRGEIHTLRSSPTARA